MDPENNKNQIDELNENLEELTKEIDESNSNQKSFIKGLFLGVGSTLGATIIAAMIIAALVWLLNIFQDVPFVNDIIDWLNIKQYIEGVK